MKHLLIIMFILAQVFHGLFHGTIISQSINPTITVWCIVEWDNNPRTGSVSLYDDLHSISGDKPVDIGEPQAICEGANAGPDVTICLGASTIIGNSSVAGYTYSWSPTTGLNDPNIAQPTANPSATTIYTLTAQNNLITNGGFEQGLTGFVTDYTVIPNYNLLCGPYGRLGVNSNPNNVNGAWCSYLNHTPNGSNMLVIDGSCTVNQRVWSQAITVTPNHVYTFQAG
jgi:hypothetical protein